MLYTFLLLNLRNNNDIFEFSIETDWCGEISIDYAEVIREEDMVQNRKGNDPSGIELEPYEERTLQNFLEKLLSDTRKMGWKIWLKRRYVYIWKNRR